MNAESPPQGNRRSLVSCALVFLIGIAGMGEVHGKGLPTLWLGIPDSAPKEIRLLEDRLKSAIEQSGEQLIHKSPVGTPRVAVNTVSLQTNLIMGVEHFYAGRLEKSEELITQVLNVLDTSPSIFREGIVSLPQVREAAMLMVRLHLKNGREEAASQRVKWMLFAFPNIEISLEKYPNSVVALANSVRDEMGRGGGMIAWEVQEASPQACTLIINGTREFSSSPAKLPAGQYVGVFRCGKHLGWERAFTLHRGQRLRLVTSPRIEPEVALGETSTKVHQWPKNEEFLSSFARLIGIHVATLTPRPHPAGAGMILVAEKVGPQGNRATLGWAEVPETEVGASTTALVLGSIPEASPPSSSSVTPWAIGAFSTGAALLLGGFVTNVLHNNDVDGPSTVDQVNRSSNIRMTSLALYGVGGTALVSGLIIQFLGSSTAPSTAGLSAPPSSRQENERVMNQWGLSYGE